MAAWKQWDHESTADVTCSIKHQKPFKGHSASFLSIEAEIQGRRGTQGCQVSKELLAGMWQWSQLDCRCVRFRNCGTKKDLEEGDLTSVSCSAGTS